MNGIEKVKPTGHAHPHTHTTWQRKQKQMCDVYKLWNMRKDFHPAERKRLTPKCLLGGIIRGVLVNVSQ